MLASGSAVRRQLLENAGVPHTVDPASVDEVSVRDSLLAEDVGHGAIAETLAELKAQEVSARHGGALVLGADQVLSCAGKLFEKPPCVDKVEAHLAALMGKPHALCTSAVVVRDGDVLWHHNSSATLHMRKLSDTFLASYVASVGAAVCASVGAYQLEGLGAQLFDSIEGDHFDILGLPLLPLLAFLRNEGVIEA
ncbi:MAG: Maf family protein [Alphaproteobacteria bacterium]|nr:Maf family protein [Alphaproteobacteria bacterium]